MNQIAGNTNEGVSVSLRLKTSYKKPAGNEYQCGSLIC